MVDSEQETRVAKFTIDELTHFATQYRVRPMDGPPDFLNASHYESVRASRAAELELSAEPFVGYARATKAGDDVRLLICRHYTPLSLKPQHAGTYYASYLSPMGQIITASAGSQYGHFALIEKAQFRPLRGERDEWDAVDCRLDFADHSVLVRSMRALLLGQTQGPYQREFRYTVQLPAQAILDAAQDEIFRLPLNRYVRISGGPGTGKTTVLLKRLSQKTKDIFLTDEERALIKRSGITDGKQWILFSPSDLLKSYLKEALAKELLPASDEHVKVYSTFRLEVLRDMSFIRVGAHGFFRMAPEKDVVFLKNSSNRSVLSLSRAFGEFLKAKREQLAQRVVQALNNDIRVPLGHLSDEAQNILKAAIDILSKANIDDGGLREAQRRASEYRLLNTSVNELIQRIRKVAGSDSIDLSSMSSIVQLARDLVEVSDGLNIPDTGLAMFPEVPRLVQIVRKSIREAAEALAISKMFRMISPTYAEFRESTTHGEHYFLETCAEKIKERAISEPELDVLLYHAQSFAHSLPNGISPGSPGITGDLQALLSRLRLIVMVDEATDFSPMELACMEGFAVPKYGGVTISGDLMQRVTEKGLRTWDDMSTICRNYEAKDLTTGYRQTQRLFAIAQALCEHVTESQQNFRSAYEMRVTDPPALSFRSTDDVPVEEWLTARICEIFAMSEHHLPTTAVLVPKPEDVAPLVAKLLPRLHENGLQLDASHNGLALGDAARVRVFPVEYIKGLEFEAVFYVGIDRMAEIHRDLLDKYVYVGLSRARSFLGVTYERQFPQRLKYLEGRFEFNGTWGATVAS